MGFIKDTRCARAAVRPLIVVSLAACFGALAFAQGSSTVPLQMKAAGSYLGIGISDVDAGRAKALKLNDESGAEVRAVEEGGAADQGGVRLGDVIVSYNGEKVISAKQLMRLISETPQGRKIRLTCWRSGEQKDLWVITGPPRLQTENADFPIHTTVVDVPAPIMLWRNLILGIESEALSDQLAKTVGVKQGILIWNVAAGSPAQQAGLRAGDVVTGFCKRTIRSPRDLGMTLLQLPAGQTPLSLDLVRDHKPMSLTMSLDVEH